MIKNLINCRFPIICKKSVLQFILHLLNRFPQFRVYRQVMFPQMISGFICWSVKIECVRHSAQLPWIGVGLFCSSRVVSSKRNSLNRWKELVLFASLVAFVQLIDNLDESGLELFHVVFWKAFLFLLKFQQDIILDVHHLIASGILLNFLWDLVIGLHRHDSLELVFNDNFRILLSVINNYDVIIHFHSRASLFTGNFIKLAIIFKVVGNCLDLKFSLVRNFLLFYGLFLLLLHFFQCVIQNFGMLL